MSYVTLEQAKAHLLVIHDSDDELIQQNIDAAEAYAANYMNRPDIDDDPVNPWARNRGTLCEWKQPLKQVPCVCPEPVVSSEPSDPVPKSVVQAILLLVCDYYENRTVGVAGAFNTNPAADNLLWQNRIGMGI